MAEKFIVEPFAQFYVLRRSERSNAGIIDNLADAHLFAASPLMLEALTRLLEIIERDDNVTHNIEYADLTILDQARAAIAAAKGE